MIFGCVRVCQVFSVHLAQQHPSLPRQIQALAKGQPTIKGVFLESFRIVRWGDRRGFFVFRPPISMGGRVSDTQQPQLLDHLFFC